MKHIFDSFRSAKSKRPTTNETQPAQVMTQSGKLWYGNVPGQLVFPAISLGLLYGWWRAGVSGCVALIAYGVTGLFAFVGLTFCRTQFQAAPPRVLQHWLFLGFIPIWRRDCSLGNFIGVQCRHRERIDGENQVLDTWTVGLVKPSGRLFPVQCFMGYYLDDPYPEADAYASRLAELTGLPLLDTLKE